MSDGQRVKINQVGYLTDRPKVAIVEGEGLPQSFAIVTSDGMPVFEGRLQPAIAYAASGLQASRADFTPFRTPGSYRLEVSGVGRSYPFEIGDSLYERELALLLRSYTLQRANVTIDDKLSGVQVPAGHLNDALAVVYFEDGVSRKGDTLEASGGWYDAGDFGKYISPAAVSTAQLLLAFELYPDAFGQGQMAFPEELWSAAESAEMPDILAEVRVELEWMLKMQRSDGAVYHKLSGAGWPGMVMPHTDTQTRYVFGLSTFTAAQFAGAAAQASRIYKPYDSEFAAELLAAAERAQAWLNDNPAFLFRRDEGQDNGSGAYGKSSDAEERLWAAAELFRTTGNPDYGDIAERYADLLGQPSGPVNWADARMLAQWAYFNAPFADARLKERIAQAFVSSADEIAARASSDGYLTALKLEDYHWASAKLAAAYGCLLLLADRIAPNETYVNAALDQLHFVFGRTATGYSYVTSVGSQYPRHPHHRTVEASGVLFPGLVVGGPNKNGGDPDLNAVKDQLAPALAYLDVLGSFSSNEYAIDYNAPVVMLAARFSLR